LRRIGRRRGCSFWATRLVAIRSRAWCALAGLCHADAYLNANAWHSDNQYAGAYQDASDDQKQHDERCAEIRVVSGSACVRAGGFSFGGVGAPGR